MQFIITNHPEKVLPKLHVICYDCNMEMVHDDKYANHPRVYGCPHCITKFLVPQYGIVNEKYGFASPQRSGIGVGVGVNMLLTDNWSWRVKVASAEVWNHLSVRLASEPKVGDSVKFW